MKVKITRTGHLGLNDGDICDFIIGSGLYKNSVNLFHDYNNSIEEFNNYHYTQIEPVEFTKDMLVSGKHVVKMRNGDIRLFLVTGFIDKDGKSRYYMNNYEDDLMWRRSKKKEQDIMAIYEIREYYSSVLDLEYILNIESLDLVWKREEKTPNQIKLEQLENEQRDLANDFKKKQDAIADEIAKFLPRRSLFSW